MEGNNCIIEKRAGGTTVGGRGERRDANVEVKFQHARLVGGVSVLFALFRDALGDARHD